MNSLQQSAGGDQARPVPTFVGNSNDLVALIGITISGIGALCCATAGNIVYCLPLVGLALGIVGWVQANRAVDPERTRTLSIISTISMAAVFAFIVCAFLAYIAFIIILVVASTGAGAR